MPESCIATNLARLRLDRELTQADLALAAGLSRIAVGKIERGAVIPQERTLERLAKALGAPVRELVSPVRHLTSVRFRAATRVRAREQILARVATWLDDYRALEDTLEMAEQFKVRRPSQAKPDPIVVAWDARRQFGLRADQPVQDICGLLEKHGVKVLLLDTRRHSFFGLSVGSEDGGPAVVVNTWDRISVERWIFTAAHELGHLLLHPGEYDSSATDLPVDTEREADAFASEFLMPKTAFEAAWHQTDGHSLLLRVLKVKRIFSGELQDRTLSAGGVGPKIERRLGRVPAATSQALWSHAAQSRRTGRSGRERVRVALGPLRRAGPPLPARFRGGPPLASRAPSAPAGAHLPRPRCRDPRSEPGPDAPARA